MNGQLRQFYQSVELPVDFSIGSVFYLLNGIIGLILGNMIKTLISYKDKIQQEIEGKSLIRVSADLIFKKEIVGLLTSIAVGFIVLLVLSRDAIPTKGWYDSLALGVAVALLTEDQLFTKVKAVIPK